MMPGTVTERPPSTNNQFVTTGVQDPNLIQDGFSTNLQPGQLPFQFIPTAAEISIFRVHPASGQVPLMLAKILA